MNIKVLGWYNHGNTGDEAYRSAFPVLFPHHNFDFTTKIKEGDKFDAVVLGGGDVCYPGFTKYIKPLPKSVRKIAASISLTATSDFEVLANFDKVYARDHRSVAVAKEHGYEDIYLPDLTFALQGNAVLGREWLERKFAEQRQTLYDKVVVCVISNYLAYNKLDMLSRDLTNFMYFSQQVAETADLTEASFVFLPFSTKSPWDDRVSNSWVADRCKYYDKNLVVYDVLDVQTTLDIVASANACVSSRLHGTIFSTINGVPFVDITHHTKNLGFIETLGKTEWSIPYWQFNVKQYVDLLGNFLDRRGKDESLLSFSQSAKEQISAAAIL